MILVPELIAPLAHLLIRRENPVHRALRAEVTTLVEQRRVDLDGRQVHEARLVQHVEHGLPLARGQRARRRRSRCRHGARSQRAVVSRSRHREHHARHHDADQRRDLGDGVHDDPLVLLSSSGIVGSVTPKSSETFFWISQMICSLAFSALRCAISRSLAASSRASGLGSCALGPRFFGARPSSSPRSRACRHVTRCDEYSPSRRSREPIWPGSVQASASCRTFLLYSAVKRRLWALDVTSLGERGGTGRWFDDEFTSSLCLLALYTKLRAGVCLTHVGREGSSSITLSQRRTRWRS